MKAENLIQKAVKTGLVKYVENAPCDPYYATVNMEHWFCVSGGYSKTINADIDMWIGAVMKIVDVSDDSIVLA